MIKAEWIPRPSDITWTENLILSLKDGGSWAVPMNESIYQIFKTKKTYKLLLGNPNEETNQKIEKVFHLLGYKEEKEKK
jgi:hypothetical protein